MRSFQLRDYRDSVQNDPERLAEISDRLDLIHTLSRKYGESIPDILAYQQLFQLSLICLKIVRAICKIQWSKAKNFMPKSLSLDRNFCTASESWRPSVCEPLSRN